MTRSRPFTLLAGAAVLPLTALAVAGCGSGGNNANAATKSAPTPAPKPAAHAASVRVAKTGLGSVLVDSAGRTLYLFTKDSGSTSACSGACATAWPPLQGSGKAAGGAKASLLGTISDSGGKSQVTYNGHPLYTFIKDMKSGDTNGEGISAFGGRWFAVSAAGKQVSPPHAKSGSGASSSPSAPPPPAATPTPTPTPRPAPTATPTPKAPASNGIPQNNGGDQDSDNNGGPSDGDGNL